MRRYAAYVLALATAFLIAHVSGTGNARAAHVNFAPLFTYESDEEGYDLSFGGPIFEKTSAYTAVRPLYYRNDKQTDILYPFGHARSTDSYFFPLYRQERERDEKSFDLLIFSYGRNQDGAYGGVFPFYGTYYDRFGHDRLTYVLWPAYTKMVDDDKETYSILWPFFKYSKGGEFQFFPFYGYENTINYRQQYYLWPFIFHKRGNKENVDAFLPFYYYSRGDTYKGISVLWPFFTYNRNTSPELTSLTFPWPIVRYATGAYEERQFFPFYWSKVEGDTYRSKMILWPFYRRSSSYNANSNIREEELRILILSGRTVKLKNDVRESVSTTVWPFWHKHDFTDASSWYFPWIIPLHDEGFRRNYLPILTLANGSRTPSSSEVNILWKTITYSRKDERSRFELSFLFSYEHGEDYTRLGILSDLLKWKRESGKAEGRAASPDLP